MVCLALALARRFMGSVGAFIGKNIKWRWPAGGRPGDGWPAFGVIQYLDFFMKKIPKDSTQILFAKVSSHLTHNRTLLWDV
jgi:hypothetical protein